MQHNLDCKGTNGNHLEHNLFMWIDETQSHFLSPSQAYGIRCFHGFLSFSSLIPYRRFLMHSITLNLEGGFW
jgi:hypothetical protein